MSAQPAAPAGGVVIDMVTPMTPDGDLDLGGAVRLSRRLAAAGVDGLVLSAEAGEGESLDADECLALWETVAAAVGGQLPLWAGLWGGSGRSVVRLAREAGGIGMTGAALPLHGASGGSRHAAAVADASGLPLMVQAPVGPAGSTPALCDLQEALGERLVLVPDGAGLVAALCDGDGRQRVLAPDGAHALGCAALGGAGVLSAAGNLAPEAMVALWRAAVRGDRAAASAEVRRLWPLLRALAAAPKASVLKHPSRLGAVPGRAVRLPLLPLAGDRARALEAALDRFPPSRAAGGASL